VLLSLDETTVGNGIQKGPLPYEHHQPIAWTKTFRDGGRVYYNNMGHSESTWATAPFQTSIVNGVRWVGKVRPDAGCLDGTGDVSTRLSPPAPRRADVGHRCALPDIEPRNGSTWETHDAVSRLTEKGGSADLAAGVAGGLAWGAQYWVLDLHRSGSRQAKVTVRLTWPSPTDDYDLSVTTGWGVYGSHEAVGTTTERLVLRHVPQCALLQMNGENMDAASGQAPTVTAKVTPKVSRSAQPAPTSRSLPT
jgi:hypothetical protein